MTIKDFVLGQPTQSINEWIKVANALKMTPLEKELVIKCADYYNKITINHSASFIKAINA